MIKTIHTTILFCLYMSSCFSQSPDNIYATADSLLKAGNFDESIPYYDELINRDKSNEFYYRGRGYAYIELNDPEKGEIDIKKALELNPTCSNCYSNLGRIEANKGNLDQAIKFLNLAIEKDSKNDNAFYIRARIKELKNDNASAVSDYNKAIQLNPNVPIYHSERGRYHMISGNTSLAIRDMNKAVMLDSNDIHIVYTRAQYFTNVQDWNKALIDLNRCIVLDPNNYRYSASKGTVFEFLEKHNEAIENYNLSLQLDSSHYLTYLNRAISRYNLEDMDGSCEDNNAALQLIEKSESNKSTINHLTKRIDDLCNPSKKSYYYQRGIAAYNLSQFENAVSNYDQGLIKFPNSPMLLSFRANAFKALEKNELAIIDYENFIQHKNELESEVKESQAFEEAGSLINNYLTGSIATVYGSLSECYANSGSYETAIYFADSAITLLLKYQYNPQIAELLSSNYNSRGVIYNVQGNYEKAMTDFTEAIKFSTSNALPHVNLAFALINDRNALEYNKINMGFYVNSTYSGAKGITMPLFNKKRIKKDNLIEALTECNVAIQLDKELAIAYLVRAQIKLLLDQPGFCMDALTASELGILNAEEQLGVKCN